MDTGITKFPSDRRYKNTFAGQWPGLGLYSYLDQYFEIKYLWFNTKMTDTPQHIKDLQLKLWLSKTPGERLYQFIKDNDETYQALRELKIKMGLPLDGLDPAGEYLKKKQSKRADNK